MKKLILFLMVGGFVLASCQKDDLNSEMELSTLESKAKVNNENKDDSCDDDEKCETAFGRKCVCPNENTCFSELGMLGSNRWGWSVLLDSYDTYNFNLYAGAGQCNFEDKGTQVGTVKVEFKADGTVEYRDLNIFEGFSEKEFHFYAGDTPTPINEKNGKPTVAPGQYYNNGDLDNSEGTLGEPDGIVYVILHAVVCEDVEQ